MVHKPKLPRPTAPSEPPQYRHWADASRARGEIEGATQGATEVEMPNLAEIPSHELQARSALQPQNHFNIFPALLVNINFKN